MVRRKTHEQFTKEVYDLVGDEYEVLNTYTGAKNKIKFRHNNPSCNFCIYFCSPTHFLNGNRCPKCAGNKKKTHDEFKQEIFNLVGNEYVVIGKYINNSTKIKLKHNNESCDNYEYYVNPQSFLSGTRCPKCNGNARKTQEQFVQEVYELVGDDYVVLGIYANTHTKIKMKHCLCNKEYDVSPCSFLYGSRCPYCSRHFKLDTDCFIKDVYKLVGYEYSVLGEYKGSHIKIKMKHNICNHVYNVEPTIFLYGSRCPKCFGNFKKTTTQFKEDVKRVVGNEYEVIDEYINAFTKINIKHNKCGFVWHVSPDGFLNGENRCPQCAESKGERKIRKWLKENNFVLQSQMKFDELIGLGGGNLSYDFYLPKFNLLIEYQGEQHERFIEWFHETEDNFKKQQEHDTRKRQFANDNGIKLLEIWYSDFDRIEEILKNNLI